MALPQGPSLSLFLIHFSHLLTSSKSRSRTTLSNTVTSTVYLSSPRDHTSVTLSPSKSSRFWPPFYYSVRESLRLERPPPRTRPPLRRSTTMPHPVEQPAEPVVLVRDLEADEQLVISQFERHASHCSQCADPMTVLEEKLLLCKRGNQYARDVVDYLRSKNGKIYSVVDLEHNRTTLVKVPLKNAAARQLLLAIEQGLCVLPKTSSVTPPPVISYDPAPPRRASTQENMACTTIIEREPRSLKRRRVIVYTSPRSSPSRGSLYEADAADRIERVNRTSRIYRPSEYYR
ncbi:hypothetical protein BO94DRAFT_536474 [Aspergillus sclerotioniger CBS 115572]|uniref:Uncharacterized protein n=1 Tax=Aspergillus sclerotioniger CBS 115572 TaxID=1450535 RepID=A0A317WBC7_9EURO|nr:hypothetical protein BO94DRAFT_536474 [Aspergillus sclerotioniger CBS 115572]PWY83796.1 hypothetical protein BO94DRAFT_536474 [Aspergillus sclerotioniger CBS 115572]